MVWINKPFVCVTQTDWDSQRVLAVDINRIESISISSQKLLSHSTASSATVEVRQHSQPPPHRHQFLKLEKRNEMNEEKEAASSLDEASEVFRHKRFYPMHVNIGCVKGYKCCTDARCKPFCTLCYGKTISFNSQIGIDKYIFQVISTVLLITLQRQNARTKMKMEFAMIKKKMITTKATNKKLKTMITTRVMNKKLKKKITTKAMKLSPMTMIITKATNKWPKENPKSIKPPLKHPTKIVMNWPITFTKSTYLHPLLHHPLHPLLFKPCLIFLWITTLVVILVKRQVFSILFLLL